MRMNKGGVTPCDRRLDRRKVTLAAAAVLFLSVTSAYGVVVDLVINPVLSNMTQVTTTDLSGFSLGVLVDAPQQTFAGPSNKANFAGTIYADFTGTPGSGTIQLLPGGSVNAIRYGGGAAVFIPGEDNTGAPQYPPGSPFFGPTSPHGPAVPVKGVYGTVVSAIGAFTLTDKLAFTPMVNPVMTMTAGTFDENASGGQVFGTIDGYQDLVSALGSGHTRLSTAGPSSTPFPLPLGSLGAAIGTWNGVTLTIPINSIVAFTLTSGTTAIPVTVTTTGVLVATVRVPEPSSMILCGFGVVGLLSYAVRSRKRRALVA